MVWGRSGRTGFSDSRSRPALSQPGPGLRLSRRVCPAGCRRRPVRVPVPRPARAGALPRCAGAARRLSGCRLPVPREPASGGGHVQAEALLPVPAGVLPAAQPPPRTPSALCRPCPQVPASLHAPASCSAWRPGAGRGSGTPWSIPGTADCCPRRGPGWRRWTCRQPGAARRALPPVRNVRGSRGRRAPPCGRPLFPGPLNRWAGPGPGWVVRSPAVLQGGLEGPDRPIGFAPRLSGGQTDSRARCGTGIR